MRRKREEPQEMGLGDALTYVTEGEVQYQGRKATIKINQETCVGASMCVISCPVDIFKSTPKSHLVKENVHKCLLHACMKCRDNCPTGSVLIRFEESF
jgi:NAD-dependent dihydropyrimidine dehydrogenase PreA subunit